MIVVIPSVVALVILAVATTVLYVLKHPDIVDKWSAIYNKYKLFKDDKSEKRAISLNLDYKITSVARRLNSEASGIMPFGMRIKWRSPAEVESYVQRDEVVVVLQKKDNSDKNVIDACMAFVPKALLPKSRNCIDPELLSSIDHFMVKELLNAGTYDSAYNSYCQSILNPLQANRPTIKDQMDNFDKMNEIGFFTRVLLEEFRRIGVKLYGTNDEASFINESKDFYQFVKAFVRRKPGDRTRLSFLGQKVRIGIVFVASKVTLNLYGIEAHLKRIERDIADGCQRIFVFSYSQPYFESVTDQDGFVVGVNKRRDFIALNQIEERCRGLTTVRILRKEKYESKDASGHKRYSKYLLLESLA
jgi:hypothetical protein